MSKKGEARRAKKRRDATNRRRARAASRSREPAPRKVSTMRGNVGGVPYDNYAFLDAMVAAMGFKP